MLGKGLINVQVLMICLKADGFISANWTKIFIIYWMFLALSLGIVFALGMLNLAKCCALVFAEIEKYESKLET